MTHHSWRAFVAAVSLIVMTAGSTATSSLFVIYRAQWGLTSADIAVVFSAYVGTLLPVLLIFGGFADRFGRRPVSTAGTVFMLAGLVTLILAPSEHLLLVARLLQGIGVGLSIGAISAAFAESYRGRFPSANALQVVAAIGLATGPAISAVAFNLGGGLHLSYVPVLLLAVGILALTPSIAERTVATDEQPHVEKPYPPAVVWRALLFALPLVFISWASVSLYFSLVPAYLASSLHAVNPLIGAAALLAAQISSIAATWRFATVAPERAGIVAPIVMVVGLVLLVVGTSTNIWPCVALATILVGSGGGVASAAAFGVAARIGRGQRARVFSRMFVGSYLGYSTPALAVGIIAAHASLAAGFITVIAVLAAISAVLPMLRAPAVCPQASLSPAA
jgi:hypothetical protein